MVKSKSSVPKKNFSVWVEAPLKQPARDVGTGDFRCLHSTNAHRQGKWGHKLKKSSFALQLRLPDLQSHRFILLGFCDLIYNLNPDSKTALGKRNIPSIGNFNSIYPEDILQQPPVYRIKDRMVEPVTVKFAVRIRDVEG
jgi:hypothetical protein